MKETFFSCLQRYPPNRQQEEKHEGACIKVKQDGIIDLVGAEMTFWNTKALVELFCLNQPI